MGCLLITIAATILAWHDIISINAYLCIVFGTIVGMWVLTALYFKFGFLKVYYHDLLGWHIPDDSPQGFDGCSVHAKCKHCGEEIMQDSQGNWFTFK